VSHITQPPCLDAAGTFAAGDLNAAPRLRTAAVVYGPDDDVDAALAFSADTLGRAGLMVGGLLQRFGERIAVGKREMLLRVLPAGETIRLNDPRGSGVLGCILDTDALARAAVAFRRANAARPDLLLASRFGKEEAAGGGMRAELAEALMTGVPVLVPVRRALLPDWRAFLGEPADELPPTTNAILLWAGRHAGTDRGQGTCLGTWLEYCATAPMSW
jgi:molybdate transport system ATP-binding protein